MRRALPLAVLFVVALERPALANGVHGGGGPSSLLLAAGAVLLVGGIWWIVKRHAGVLGWLGVAAGLGVGVLAFVLTGGPGTPHATVAIVQPEAGSEVAAQEPVTVRVRILGDVLATSPTDTSGGHLHLYVDGKLQQMPYSNTTDVTLVRGPHRLKVEFVDNRHLSYQPKVVTYIDVVAT